MGILKKEKISLNDEALEKIKNIKEYKYKIIEAIIINNDIKSVKNDKIIIKSYTKNRYKLEIKQPDVIKI